MKKILVVANWKMNPASSQKAEELFREVEAGVRKLQSKNTGVVIAPPVVYLPILKKYAQQVSLGAQDALWGIRGPYTGEISPAMLKDLGVRYVLVGHSERRRLFGETDEMINKKVLAVLGVGLTPILLVGEKAEEHENMAGVVGEQLRIDLRDVTVSHLPRLIIAYEPVWAISTTENRRDATPRNAYEARGYIEKFLGRMFGQKNATKARIIYGGSADSKNSLGFIREGGMQGVLPGAASLNAKEFLRIIDSLKG